MKAIQRCHSHDHRPRAILIFDPTCGSGTTAHVAEQWGRPLDHLRYLPRSNLALTKQRLMTAMFTIITSWHIRRRRCGEWISSYKTVPHVTLGSIANNPDIREGMSREGTAVAIARHAPQETLYDQPQVDKSKARVTGPFTVEAVPAPAVKPLDEIVR